QRDARALPQRAEHEEVTKCLGHAEASGEGLRVGPRLRLARACFERAHDGSATVGLGGYEARNVVAGDPSDLAELLESLPHADEADATAGRIDDDVGQLPFELLGELVAHRLLPLDAVGLLQRRRVVPSALGTRALDDRSGV